MTSMVIVLRLKRVADSSNSSARAKKQSVSGCAPASPLSKKWRSVDPIPGSMAMLLCGRASALAARRRGGHRARARACRAGVAHSRCVHSMHRGAGRARVQRERPAGGGGGPGRGTTESTM
jgi:hypothetical protein